MKNESIFIFNISINNVVDVTLSIITNYLYLARMNLPVEKILNGFSSKYNVTLPEETSRELFKIKSLIRKNIVVVFQYKHIELYLLSITRQVQYYFFVFEFSLLCYDLALNHLLLHQDIFVFVTLLILVHRKYIFQTRIH